MTLPRNIGDVFTVDAARAEGIGRGRLRGSDLESPFSGVRAVPPDEAPPQDPYEHAAVETLRLARAYSQKMRDDEFFAYATAARIFGAPLPTRLGRQLHPLDVAVFDSASLPRSAGVRGRRLHAGMTHVVTHDGFAVSSPASTWAMLGAWSITDLVALGDFFCRVWRRGVGRRDVGKDPLATPDQLAAALAAGRRRGAPKLRAALDLIRTDSWSPRESACRVHLMQAGLPEPELNVDLFDSADAFLGCFDLVYRSWKVALEYQGAQHRDTYADDVERIERARAAGWIVIQVTSTLHDAPLRLVKRVSEALLSRGWRPAGWLAF